jgi:prostaglandin-endoperoxide synthase 2
MARASAVGSRSTTADGRSNRREFWFLTHLRPVWRIVQGRPKWERIVNGRLIDRAVAKMPYRPNPFSTMSPYTSWASLTDRAFSSRHLPATTVAPSPDLPGADDVAEVFMREDGRFIPSEKSTVLFSYFAQWFTDGFLRSDRANPPDPRKNDSNHEIDLMQVYGLTPAVTDQLRLHEGGLLKFQTINGEEYPCYAYDSSGKKYPEFDEVPDVPTKLRPDLTPEELSKFFAVGSDTANLQLGFVLMNVLFFREHNRVARELAARYTDWDDDRLFETARNILVVLLIKIVVEEYINHITPYYFQFRADPTSFKNPSWYRPNWMAVEFNLVYRWHPLVPNTYRIAGRDVSVHDTLYETEMLTDNGLAQLFEDASSQAAGKIGLFNTPPELRQVQAWSVEKGRAVELATYNDYRELCGYPRVTAFDEISASPKAQQALKSLYGTVDRIEFYTGLYAEDVRPNSVLPSLIGRMVGIDAFSQAFTNPLLAPRVFNEKTFSELGLDIIRSTRYLSDILHRNIPQGSPRRFVSMTRRDWKRSRA